MTNEVIRLSCGAPAMLLSSSRDSCQVFEILLRKWWSACITLSMDHLNKHIRAGSGLPLWSLKSVKFFLSSLLWIHKDRLLWQDKTCPACIQLIMSWNAIISWTWFIIIIYLVTIVIFVTTNLGLVQGIGQGADVSASAHTCSGEEHRWEGPPHCRHREADPEWDWRCQGGETQRASWQCIS